MSLFGISRPFQRLFAFKDHHSNSFKHIHKYKDTIQGFLMCNKLEIYMELPFRLLQEELTPCYAKMSGATLLVV